MFDSKPEITKLGDDYDLTWYDADDAETADSDGNYGVSIVMKVRGFVTKSDGDVKAEVEVLDYSEPNPQLCHPIRITLNGPMQSLLSKLKKRSYRDEEFWDHRLTQMSFHCLQGLREGEPVIDLSTREAPALPRQIITDIAWEGMPTVIYGSGGVGKSMLGLAFANAVHSGLPIAGLEAIRGNALILDYETSWDETWRRSSQILAGAGVGREKMVYYRFCTSPLSQDLPALKRQIAEKDISFVVVDSVAPACGGDPEMAASTIQYFNALRALSSVDKPITSISIAHVKKNSEAEGSSGPFGSVYWTNLPRAVFNVYSGQRENTNFVDIGMVHTKTNVGKLLTKKGFRITWDGGVRIEAIDPNQSELLESRNSIGDRAYYILKTGARTRSELAEDLGVGEKSLSSTLSYDSRFESTTINSNGTQQKVWQIKEDIDVLG